MFRSKSINQFFIVLTLFVASQTHQLQGAQSAAAAAAPSPKQTLTPEEQAAANASLFAVVKSGDIQAVRDAIAQGADLNAKDENGKTLLYKEAINGDVRGVNTLLSLGAELPPKSMLQHRQLTDQEQQRVDDQLIEAVEYNNIGDAIIAIVHGANVNKQGYRVNKMLALEIAIQKGSLNMVKVLLNYGADPNVKHSFLAMDYPLIVALESIKPDDYSSFVFAHNTKAIVSALLRAGANPNVIGFHGQYPLMVAVQKGYDDLFQELLDHGADLDVLFGPNSYGSDEQLSRMSIFAGLKKEYWNPAKIKSLTDLLLRRMYINYQIGKDKKNEPEKNEPEKKNEPDKNEQKKKILPEYKTFLEILEGQTGFEILAAKARSIVTPKFMIQRRIPPKALEQYLLNATPHTMLQEGVPFEMQQKYLLLRVLSPHPEDVGTTRDFEELEKKVKAREYKEIMNSKQNLSEQQEQLKELNERWKKRLEEQETRQPNSNHAEFLKALDEEHKQVEQALLEKARARALNEEHKQIEQALLEKAREGTMVKK